MTRFRKNDWIVMAAGASLQGVETALSEATMFHPAHTLPSPGQARLRRSMRHGGLWQALLATLHLWQRRQRSRRELRELDEHVLRDIGISRSLAQYEGGKPFWRD